MEMNQNQIMELLDALYEKSINGIPKLSQPIDVLANDYLSKNNSTEKAARQFQIEISPVLRDLITVIFCY